MLVPPGFLPDDLLNAYAARRARHDNPAVWTMPRPYLHVPELRALALYPPLLRMVKVLGGEPMLLHPALTGWVSTHQDDYLNPPFIANWHAAVRMGLDDISAGRVLPTMVEMIPCVPLVCHGYSICVLHDRWDAIPSDHGGHQRRWACHQGVG